MAVSTRPPLTVNAVLSLLSGLVIGAIPATVGNWLGVDVDGWLRAIGLLLIGHGLLLVWAARRPDPTPFAKLNLLAIAPYPALMVALVASGLIDRSLGQVLALVDGAIVGAIAIWHWSRLREPVLVGHPQHA